MAELIFGKMLKDKNLQDEFEISSAATSYEEDGHPIYYHAKSTLEKHGIYGEHRARKITKRDIEYYDYILVMDGSNLRDVKLIAGGKYGDKIHKLMSFTGEDRDVADPWYTRNFEKAYSDICAGLSAFLNYLGK